MKNIISRKNFLNEYKSDYEIIKDLIFDFVEKEGLDIRFSSYFTQNGDKDIEKLKEHLLDNNINLDRFMVVFHKQIYNDSEFTQANGFFDYLLYKYDNDYPLHGSEIGPEPEDKILKYYYGYQTKKLGKLYLLQNYDSLSNFYKDCAKNIPSYFELNTGEKIPDKNIKIIYGEKFSISCIYTNKYVLDKFISNINIKNYEIIANKLLIIGFGDNINFSLYYDEIEKWKPGIFFEHDTDKYNL